MIAANQNQQSKKQALRLFGVGSIIICIFAYNLTRKQYEIPRL